MRYFNFFLFLLLCCGCGGTTSQHAHDFTTPEGAILCLEDAYRAKDVDAAIKCRNFDIEAQLMMEKVNPEFSTDKEILAKTAEVLELAYRAEMSDAFPNFDGVTSTFSQKQPYQDRDDVVSLIETTTYRGRTNSQQLHAAKTEGGWRVVTIPGD